MLQTRPHNVHALCLALVLHGHGHGHGSWGHRSWGGCHVMGLKHRSQVSMTLNDENFVHLLSGCSQHHRLLHSSKLLGWLALR